MSSARYPRRAVSLLGFVALVLALFALPADALRVRNPSASLQLGVPTVTCGANPVVNLTWTDSASSATANYRVMSRLAGTKQNSWSANGWLGNARSATFAAANGSSWLFVIEAQTSVVRDSNSRSVTVNCPVGDTTAPSVPASASASVASCTSTNLSWAASTDTGGSGLRGYHVYRNSALVKTVLAPTTTAVDSALAPATRYSYAVAAIDVAGNESALRSAPDVTTPLCPNVAPTANAGADRSTMTMTNLSFNGSGSSDADGTIVSYSWSWGDGSSASAGVNASHSYSTPGTYTVTLTVTDDRNGTDTDTASVTVGNRTPTANAGSDRSGLKNESIGFDGTASSDADGTVMQYHWNYGDGTNGTGGWATHAYAATGTYTVTLTVTDNLGATGTDTAVVTIGLAPNQPPVAVAEASNSISALNGTVSVTGANSSDPDGTIVGYAWSWGDGTANGSGVSASHTYTAPGTYTVRLTVTDDRGATANDTLTVTVTNAPPVAAAGADRTAAPLAALNFSGSGSSDPDGTIANYAWSWGDGTANGSGVSPSHTYAAVGVYTVRLTVTDNFGATAADTLTVSVVNASPTAAAGTDRTTPTLSPLTFSGAGSSDPDGTIASYVWSWGDGTANSSGVNATHTYGAAGAYTVTLTVTDNLGATAFDTAIVTVTNRTPTANAGQDAVATSGATIGFTASGSSDPDGTIVSYAWNWADGTANGSGAAPTHVFSTPGTYTVTLFVTDNNGAMGTDTVSVTVNAPPLPPSGDTWSRQVSGTDIDAANAVATDAAGNAYAVGNFYGMTSIGGTTYTSAGQSDVWIAKYSPTGAVVWSRTYGGAGSESTSDVVVDAFGNVNVAATLSGTASFGGSDLTSAGSSDFVLAQYDAATGAHRWSKRFGGTLNDRANGIAVDGSGNIFVTGYFIGTMNLGGSTMSVPFSSDLDLFLAKFDRNGAHVWSKNFPNDANDQGTGIAVDGAGNVVVTGSLFNSINFSGNPLGGSGTLSSPGSMTDVVVAKFTNDGAYLASTKLGSSTANDSPRGVAVDASGAVFAVGTTVGAVDLGGGVLPAVGSSDGWVVKLRSSDLGHVWSKKIASTNNDYPYSVTTAADGDPVVVGSFTGTMTLGATTFDSPLADDAYVARLENATGAVVAASRYGGLTTSDKLQDVAMSGGHVVAVGYFYGAGAFEGGSLTSAGAADGVISRLSL